MTASAGATAPAPRSTPAAATRQQGSMQQATGTPQRRSRHASPTRRAGTTASALGRLTAATVLACTLNGAAAYLYVESSAVTTSQAAAARQRSLDVVSETVADMGSTAERLRSDGRDEAAYRSRTAQAAREIVTAATWDAPLPTSLPSDGDDFAALSAGYTTYVADLERARSVPAAEADAAFRKAAQTKAKEVDPVLRRVLQTTAARAESSRTAATTTTGVLAGTTVASLAALLLGANWLARRTKRVINPGLLAATLVSAATSGYAFSRLLDDPPVPNGPWTAPVVLLGGLAAAGLAWAGLEQRRKEYR